MSSEPINLLSLIGLKPERGRNTTVLMQSEGGQGCLSSCREAFISVRHTTQRRHCNTVVSIIWLPHNLKLCSPGDYSTFYLYSAAGIISLCFALGAEGDLSQEQGCSVFELCDQ